MANDIQTKVWDLDTAGVVSANPVQICGISITWTAGVGTVHQVTLSQVKPDTQDAGAELFFVTEMSTAIPSGKQTRFYPIETTSEGLHLTTFTKADKLLATLKKKYQKEDGTINTIRLSTENGDADCMCFAGTFEMELENE